MNIVEPILFQAKYQPGAPALCAQGIDVVSYARLAEQMSSVARRAFACGLKRGDVVALSIDQPLLHATVILGLTLAGIIPVSVAGQKPPSGLKLHAMLRNAHYPFAPDVKHFPLDFSWIAGHGTLIEPVPAGGAASHETCRIVLTAGTTGDAKAVALTHQMVMARNARFDYVVGNRQPTFGRVYVHMGLAAALGYQFLTHILGRGGTVFFRGDSMDNTLRAFEVFRIEAMLATPTTLARLLSACDQHPGIDFHLDTIVSGGSLLPRELAEQLRPRLCANLITGYGSTETAISATAPAHRIAHIPGAAGYVTPGIRIEIVDEADRPLPAGNEGIVRIVSEFAVDRYIDDPVESARAFRNGWFYPGDLGILTDDNLLIISGRQNNVLNAGGDKMAAEKIEAVLLSYRGVAEAAVFMAADKLGVDEVWAALVCSNPVDRHALRDYCKTRMPPAFVPAHIEVLEAFPVNAVGKVDRPRLKQMLVSSGSA